ncbi:MAG: GatB/YqeY domain-containing protein, partial [Caldimonas sp.]
IAQFTAGNRSDLVEKEEAEQRVLESYLPQRMGAAEVEAEVARLVAELGATAPTDMGKVMSAAKARFAGEADMTLVSASVKQALSR